MAPTKPVSARPAFSPPRPGKSKVTKKSKASSATSGAKQKKSNGRSVTTPSKANGTEAASRVGKTHHANNVRAKVGGHKDKTSAKSKSSSSSHSHRTQKQSSRSYAGKTRSLFDDEADEDDDEDDNMEEDGQDDEDNESSGPDHDQDDNSTHSQTPPPSSSASRASSPEPDYILAEVTTKNPPNNPFSSSSHTADPAIPPSLIHLILTHHFAHPDTTSLSTDARSLLGKYVEVFVREGIRRCVAQKSENDGISHDANDDETYPTTDKGWLEVEDLERIGVQLCLDF